MDAQEVRALLAADGISISRSARRRKTISLTRRGERWHLAVPQSYDPRRNSAQIAQLITRMERRAARGPASDAALAERAAVLNARIFDDGLAPASVVWSQQQLERFGSTTTATGAIRVSAQLREAPQWVIDAVLVHELAHLREPNHSPAFKALVARYERTAEADIYLAGFSHGRAAERARQ
ncbi:M48 family metallopeptidase [Brevibacterium sp. BRM-1]|uniref:M48 metallopeptidase family protein n=1 Tax=Brevibacterium sp. BRM-1 TaxID=2999062 RepID=UPI002282E2DB|nr:M48 family metallopeptidase [Brevibacterium sp. BRM-1]WAL40501.1 M48 family metallopeptidase [Brevibacterium sp. BRM-1]